MNTLFFALCATTLLQPPPTTPPAPTPQAVSPASLPPSVELPRTPKTDAEKIANAQDAVKQATMAVEKIQKRLEDPNGEYQKADAEFGELNVKRKNLISVTEKLGASGNEALAAAMEAVLPGVRATLEAGLPPIQEDWQHAKERFDLAIRQKKTSLEVIAGLKERIAADQKVLDRLVGKTQPPPTEQLAELGAPAVVNPASLLPKAVGAPVEPDLRAKPEIATVAHQSATGDTSGSTKPADATSASTAPAGEPASATGTDPIVREMQLRLESQRAVLQDAEDRVRSAEEHVRIMERSIQTAQTGLQLERESIAQSEKSVARLSKSLSMQPPPTPEEQTALTDKLQDTERRLAESRTRVQRTTDRIRTMTETLTGLKDELAIVVNEASEKRTAVAATEAELQDLINPISPRNLFRWALDKGPRVVFILAGILILHLLFRQFSRHIVRFVSRHSERGSPEDRENRAHTLVGVFRYAAGLMVFGGGTVMLLDEVGVPVIPFMGGAAVLGLAVAFGAQNLIRDYFTGFMMLMEDQYSVNDVVRIGPIAGLVEQISLRMTVLRDLEGIRHFIPHGSITSVSNLTHGWSRAMLDVPVAYKENVDRVIGVLMELGHEMRRDPNLGQHILDDPEMLGVDSLADSGVVIKLLLKTRPLKQWPIKREMLRRIKNRFDELGIMIPFPHRTVYHHFPDGTTDNSIGHLGDMRSAA